MASGRYDGAVLDIMMPTDGLTVLKQIRSHHTHWYFF
ncbi:MAG: hypothetical protein V8S27_06545 [Lachnospiraceae bacterium]